jgi:hypothetical protein
VVAALPVAAGVGLFARAQIAALIDGFAGSARVMKLAQRMLIFVHALGYG